MLRSKIFLTLSAVIFSCALILFGVQQLVILPSYIDLELTEAKKDIDRCVEAFKSEIEHLNRFTFDWSAWDDTYEFIIDKNQNYIDSNLSNETFVANHLNLMYFIALDGRLVWGKAIDYKQNKDFTPDAFSSRTILENKTIRQHDGPESSHSGILMTDLGPLLFASRPIIKSDHTGAIHGTLFLGTLLDTDLVHKISDQTRVDLIAYSVTEFSNRGNLKKIVDHLTSGNPYYHEALDEHQLRIYSLFYDIYTNPVLLMKADIARKISKKGVSTVWFAQFSIITVGLITLIILIILLQYLVVRPITTMTRHAINIRESKDLSRRLDLERKDEFGLMSKEFDHMVGQVQAINASLEKRVQERTLELTNTNKRLAEEIDIRIQAEKSLRNSEIRYRNIFQNIQDVYYEATYDGKLIEISPSVEKLSQYTRDQLIGASIYDFYHNPLDRDGLLQTLEKKFSVSDYEVLFKDADGRVVYCALNAVMTMDESGQPEKIIGSIRDISARKKAEKDLVTAKAAAEKANEAKTNFLSNVSHEVRTPMNGILGMLTLLQDTAMDDAQKRYLNSIFKSTYQMMHIINDILDFSRLDTDELDLEYQEFNLHLLIKEVAESMVQKAIMKQLEFQCLMAQNVPALVRSDPGRIKQILVNLVNNAIKFTTKGLVSIDVKVNQKKENKAVLNFTVKDTGIGIADTHSDDLFASFSQIDASSTRKYEGLGLGLAIVKKICDRFKGEIQVKSKLGVGSSFTVNIPVEVLSMLKKQTITNSKILKDQHILLVDDEPTNRAILKAQLEPIGCRVDEAENGDQALDKLVSAKNAEDPYCIAILDMQMPDMNGEFLGRQIKSNQLIQDTSLVMYTSMGLRGDLSRLKRIGFTGYLNKPTSQPHLIDCLQNVVCAESKDEKNTATIITRYNLTDNSEPLGSDDQLINVSKSPSSYDPPKEINEALLETSKPSLQKLRQALIDSNPTEIKSIIPILEEQLGSEMLNGIKNKVDDYEYDEAMENLEKIIHSLGTEG